MRTHRIPSVLLKGSIRRTRRCLSTSVGKKSSDFEPSSTLLQWQQDVLKSAAENRKGNTNSAYVIQGRCSSGGGVTRDRVEQVALALRHSRTAGQMEGAQDEVPFGWELALCHPMLTESEPPETLRRLKSAEATAGKATGVTPTVLQLAKPRGPPAPRHDTLSADGHETAFAPPDPRFSRRMWAGGSMTRFLQNSLRIDDEVEQRSYVSNVEFKLSRTRGPLVLVTEERETSNGAGVCASEQRQIVYMTDEDGRPRGERRFVEPPPGEHHFHRLTTPTAIQLFRYSAAMGNAHLIHFSTPFAQTEEGYENLLVHGPLTCTLLNDTLRMALSEELPSQCPPLLKGNRSVRIRNFSYRAIAPVFLGDTLHLKGRFELSYSDGWQPQRPLVKLWAHDQRGSLAMQGTAELSYLM